ncbi:uncharacterized protein MONOS_12326 [Monocercomonoides exilis]|uniref:uncharacterized protein n=1 Tax=Monocercomonoides exilis TaxID=2049356 RepID=UPI0035594340|nr:hypothetical protein MONOS_12326 [Monocercomonoides exilis]|eukprot:MONOS_12326.1-p1 / transcript=MONOS_12326.1 / gene=MONOS_12326 / organism=Monocercomonoides_exilis_PA203 / gene_product=unspecified product / transcript_product=unspecified product / location=Mono_scaffold00676:9413-10263(-) / protein_length=143 / sequence_SO=supercontig / SO=protein_coding / is_pseudo=false
MSAESWIMERRLVHMAYPRAKLHLALQKRVNERREKRGNLFDWKKSHPLIKTQHSQLGKIKGIPSSFPMPSQSSSSSSLEISPHKPSICKQPLRVGVIERMTKSQGTQTASQLEQFCHVLEKARNKENQFMLALARQPFEQL